MTALKRRSVVPWWGRVLPWACAIGAVLCWSWALDIGGWKMTAFCVGIGLWLIGYRITEANVEAGRCPPRRARRVVPRCHPT